jgi:hypothetical protein
MLKVIQKLVLSGEMIG